MVTLTVGLFGIYQIAIFALWHALAPTASPADWLNRWSWSSADAMALAGLILSNYAYWSAYKNYNNEGTRRLQSFLSTLLSGMTESEAKDVADGMAKYILPGYLERIKKVNQRIKEGKMTMDEAIEVFR